MTTVYLHIGTQKTGTTFIQNFLLKNREQLLDKGFLFPLSGIPKGQGVIGSSCRYSQHNLVWELNKDKNKAYDPRHGGWEEVHREIDFIQPGNVILSSELFYEAKLNYDQLSIIKDYLFSYKVKIIVYLRRQDDYFKSWYCQAIKAGVCGDDISQFISQLKSYGDYYKMIDLWQELFGKENIIIRVYEKEQLKGCLIDDFLNQIHLNRDNCELNYPNFSNISPSAKTIKTMRLLNKIAIQRMSIQRRKVRQIYFKFLIADTLFAKMIKKVPDFLISNELLSTQERIALLKEFEESNQKVAQEYLGRQDGKLFYSTPE